MRWTQIIPVLMLAVFLGGQGRVAAQSTTSSGMFGNRTTGSGISPGSSSAFGSNSPLSNLGQNGASLGGTGMASSSGVGGQARQAGSFVGASTGQAAQQNFVGAAQANPSGAGQAGMGGMGSGGMGMGGMGGFGMGAMIGRRLAQGNLGSGANGATTTAPQVRTTMTLGFESAVAAPQQVNSAIAEHLMALPALHWQSPVQVEMQGRTVILRGVAATEHDRDLAERVVRLEATVDQVQNQIVVASRALPKATTVERIPAADNSAVGSSKAPDSPALAPAGTASQPLATPAAN